MQTIVAGSSGPSLPVEAPIRRRVPDSFVLGAVLATDMLMMALAGGIAVLVQMRVDGGPSPAPNWAGAAILASLLATVTAGWTLRSADVYGIVKLRRWRSQFWAIALALLPGAAIVALGLVLAAAGGAALPVALGWLGMAAVLLGASRLATAWLLAQPAVMRHLQRNVVVFGANAASQRFIERLHADRGTHDRVVAVFDDRRSRTADHHAGVPVLGRIDDLLRHGRAAAIDAIVVALPLEATARLGEVCSRLRPMVSDIYVTADFAANRIEPASVTLLGPNQVITVSRQPLGDWAGLQKRMLDLFGSGALLLLVAPLMALIALAIRIDSEGPVLFRQPRRGLNNNDFVVYKFRTMRLDAGDVGGRRQAVRNDPRVTRVGRLLRRLSFDELPQLFNVICGEMSLVGPRPHALSTRAGDRLLEDAISEYSMRHRVKPGITGWAQVNGFRGAIRNEAQLRARLDCDLYYINNWSLWLDIKILFMTLNAPRHVRNAF